MSEYNEVNHPKHYTTGAGGVECIDAMTELLGYDITIGFCLGNAFKYLWRNDIKENGTSLEKAAWYMNRMKKLLGEREFAKSRTA